MVDRIPIIDNYKVVGGVGIILVDNLNNMELRNSIINTINPKISENISHDYRSKYTFDDILSNSPLSKKCKSQAADLLGIPRITLYRKLKRMNLEE